jgi:hypothetical protein
MDNLSVDLDLDELTVELARAMTAPALRRFSSSDAIALVVDEAQTRLRRPSGAGASRIERAERLLTEWGEQLDRIGARPPRAEDGARRSWFMVAGASLALSAVAGTPGAEPTRGERADDLGGALLVHAAGVLHLEAERRPLREDPCRDLETRRAGAAEIVRRARASIDEGASREGEEWLWLELEERAARAAAAAAIAALGIA